MSDFFDNTSFSFLIDLYRAKVKAEERNDSQAITSLKQHYPELFSEKVEEFIQQTKLCTQFLDQKHGTTFTQLLKFDEESDSNIFH